MQPLLCVVQGAASTYVHVPNICLCYNEGGETFGISLLEITMARTDKFRQQHNEMLGIAKELQSLLDPIALSHDATAARICLSNLMGRLTLHLVTEDKVLYPELEASKDAEVAAMARRYSSEMKTTTAAVLAYNVRWATPSAIKADAAGFVRETTQILSALANRIKRENNELYPTADRFEGKAFC